MPTPSQPNLKLGRFEIVRELGRGAFGTVYLARDPQLERSVALKLPNVRFKERAGHEDRFLREARAAAGLHHPNIVPIHDAGQLGDHYYIAAAYIEGGTLREILRSQGCPAPATAVRLVARLADALGYAHSNGIVHRDVKPENVLLAPNGIPYLTDFGLARRIEEDQPTEKRALFGTPGYMSPEQAAGNPSGGPADQWGLGVLLYELLTGQRPFEGDTMTVLYAIQHTEPIPPRELAPQLPLDLQAICLKCLSKATEDRYVDCYALAADLERWLADEPVHARPLSLPQRIYRWNRREPLIARLYGLLLLVVTVFGLVLTLMFLHALSLRDMAVRNEQQAAQNEMEARQSRDALKSTNAELLSQKKKLEENEAALNESVVKLNLSIDALQAAQKEKNQAQVATSQAQEDAAAAQRQSLAEQAKNSKLRYFGDVMGASIAITAGQPDRALTMLADSNTAERSIEWNFLSNLAHAFDRRYEHIVNLKTLNSPHTYSILSRHFPAAATDEQHIRALRNSQEVLAVSRDAKRWLTSKGPTEILKKHLPPGAHQPRDPKYPDGPELKTLRVVATEFGDKAIIAQEDVTHAWLSPDGKLACFMVPTVEKRVVDDLNLVLSIRFRLALVDLDAPEAQLRTLNQPQPTVYDLDIRLIVAPGAKSAYNVNLPNMKAQFCGAFSPDSRRFVLYNAQSAQVAAWNVSELNLGDAEQKPVSVKPLQKYLTSGSAPCVCRCNDKDILLCVPGHLLELEATTLTVQNDRKLPEELATLQEIVFSQSGRHVAQLYTVTSGGKNSALRVQLNNCQANLSQTIEVGPDSLTFCADVSKAIKQANENNRGGALMLDWKNADLIDDADSEWISLRLPSSTQLLFEKPLKPQPSAKVIWSAPSKRPPLILKSTSNDSSILMAFSDRLVTLKRENLDERWHIQTNKELTDGAVLDAEFHGFQDSVLVCQPKRLSIISRSSNAKPRELPLPIQSSLTMVSERTLLFLNEAGRLQFASVTDGTLGTSLAVHRSGSNCMETDTQRQLVAVANSDRMISCVNLAKLANTATTTPELATTATATTREVPQRLVLNLAADLLCSIGLDSQVSLYTWPALQRVATFNINGQLLYATPSNDGKRLIVVTPTGFQILDNQFAVPLLDTQKFAVPAVAAKVTSDQSAILVFSRDGQLVKYQL